MEALRMKILPAIVSSIVLLFGCCAIPGCSPAPDGEFLGQPAPGPTAEPLALAALASRPDHYVRAVAFAPDGNEAYWPVIDTEDEYRRWIVAARLENGVWSQPRIAPFSDKRFYDDVPCLTPDGGELFYLSGRPLEVGGEIAKVRIWRVTREGDGWSEPAPLSEAVNAGFAIHQQVSVDRTGNLYFSGEADRGFGSLDIYRAPRVDGRYQEPVNLGPRINGPEGDYAPTISPDGSTLIFTRNLDEGWSLFVSFLTTDGVWTPPVDLKPHLPGIEDMHLGNSQLAADGRYLVFFGEREETCAPYWIDASFIEALRDSAGE
jgi:hypothetical protein